MDNTMILGNEPSSITVKEKRSTIKKIWDKSVKTTIKVEQMKLKLLPLTAKLVGYFVPEAKLITDALSKYLKTESGKKLRNTASSVYDSVGDALTGNIDKAMNNLEENVVNPLKDDGEKMFDDAGELIETVRGMSK